jgi:hypothetical protein
MERDPEVIEKWRAEASKTTEYYPLAGENPEKLPDLAAVERHFAEHHAPAHLKFVDLAPVPGDPKTTAVDPALAPLLNHARGEEERFPLRLAQSLSRALSAAGLRFYKSPNRTTFVSAARPRHLNLDEVPVSDSIKKILELIREKKSLRRPQLLDLLAPTAAPSSAVPGPGDSSPAAAPAVDPDPASPPTAEAVPAAPLAPAPVISADPAREALVNDLLWLTHEGYVIEYADGRLESVPPPKHPPKQITDEATVTADLATVPTAPEQTDAPVETPPA